MEKIELTVKQLNDLISSVACIDEFKGKSLSNYIKRNISSELPEPCYIYLDEILAARRRMDFNIDRYHDDKDFIKVACTYWDKNREIISEPIMYKNMFRGISLVNAVRVFRPYDAEGCNCIFYYSDGTPTDILVMKFNA